ncbi:SprT family zinc-dependent metalloprotease [Neolewinella aurantiaca]|uniref:SprT family zinc-dependent metalloprotease n=1 Tax=Neolewinella aurantiaca TaxID=2602767 RepID=A0A5C7FSN5_9BACT|nr:SprT-like domain-containing protein [Neolewinella aurantiaca]TXF89252.1 SprT family zinc-dependent metalloprotease [Neolewinella aurantiaca]
MPPNLTPQIPVQETTPTTEIYSVLQEAYESLNLTLFDGALPNCMIILRRGRNYHGHYAPDRFQNIDEHGQPVVADEIALNPHTMRRPPVDVLSTLAHEMVHLWQHKFGKPSRGGYHNKEWANKMDAIGLAPTDTGQRGGKRTGQRMTHYIVPEGKYVLWAERFLDDRKINWASSVLMMIADGMIPLPGPEVDGDNTFGGGHTPSKVELIARKKRRIKYSCAKHNVWGKPGLKLTCDECEEVMAPEPGELGDPGPG